MAKVDVLLQSYRRKRDFSRTAEPDHVQVHRREAGDRPLFVVQKHDATRLHYDFRLEWEGVLKSWAVTGGPSEDPAEKRLAVRTEDHPLAYGGFEGVIPEDQYGGGTVMLWDVGQWVPVDDFGKGLEEGKIVFRLEGQRLKGEWTLVRMKPRPGDRRENWLMIRHREDGLSKPRVDILKKHVKSVTSGRTMAEIAKSGRTLAPSDLEASPPLKVSGKRSGRTPGKEATASSSRLRVSAKSDRGDAATAVAMPAWTPPQLATLVDAAPDGDEWLAEVKYDGYRALIAVAGGEARIYTRAGLDWTDRFPGIAAAAAALPTDGTLIDGEIVAVDERGRTNFSALQAAIKAGGNGLSGFCFDLLLLDGKDVRARPLFERKAELETLLGSGSEPLVYSAHVRGSARQVLEQLCSAGHEGIVAKRADDPYHGGRGGSWLKVKCSRRQEFVIGGYTPSSKSSRPFSSLLVGLREGDRLVYKGRIGSFEGDTLEDLAPLIAERKRDTSPFADLPREIARKVRFVDPDLVGEVDFAEFTADGIVRNGVFKGLRADKCADEVVLEKARETTMTSHEQRDSFAGVTLSNPGKVLFSDQGVTKADLAAHYERVAERMLPLAGNRLLSLVRCPEGEGGQCFFQKHDSKGFPAQLKRMEIAESDGKRANYLYAPDLAGLIAGVQMGTLEFHIWGSRMDVLEKPDRLVFDLDPDEELTFADVREAAVDLRDRLVELGLQTLPLVTGGKGVHVVAPLQRRAEWPQVKAFARGFATLIAEEAPDRYVAQAAKAKRTGRIFIDWLRNERGATAIAPYSTRARRGAPVATPVSWEELARLDGANSFHIGDMEMRMGAPDPWAGASAWRQSITGRMLETVGAAD